MILNSAPVAGQLHELVGGARRAGRKSRGLIQFGRRTKEIASRAKQIRRAPRRSLANSRARRPTRRQMIESCSIIQADRPSGKTGPSARGEILKFNLPTTRTERVGQTTSGRRLGCAAQATFASHHRPEVGGGDGGGRQQSRTRELAASGLSLAPAAEFAPTFAPCTTLAQLPAIEWAARSSRDAGARPSPVWPVPDRFNQPTSVRLLVASATTERIAAT